MMLLASLPGAVDTASAQYDYIDINNPFLRKIPLAIPDFTGLGNPEADPAVLQEADGILRRALDFTGYFSLLSPEAFLIEADRPPLSQETIVFNNWTIIGAELLITGGMRVKDGLVDMELRMFDTLAAKRLLGKRYHGTVADLRPMILRFCSEVIFELTGKRGIFDSRIAFVSTGSGNKEIYICDFDGSNPRQFSRNENIAIFPSWSSDGQHLAYTSYVRSKPEIVIRKTNGQREAVVDRNGTNFAPAWHPTKYMLAATLSFSGNQEIYLLTGQGKIIKRITNNWASDLSPTWSPDGDRIAFVSNRSGSPQIYIQELDSGRVERVTFEGTYNTQPNWSPVGNRIAYTAMAEGRNDICIIDLDRRETVQLTRETGNNESPSWSPDGSLIVFSSTREGPSRLYVMTAFGTDQRRLLTLSGEQSSPSWSSNNLN
jgi:TolB protein